MFEDENNWTKAENTNNLFLRAIGNVCGAIYPYFLKYNVRWGTYYTWTPPVKKKAPAKKVVKKAPVKKAVKKTAKKAAKKAVTKKKK